MSKEGIEYLTPLATKSLLISKRREGRRTRHLRMCGRDWGASPQKGQTLLSEMLLANLAPVVQAYAKERTMRLEKKGDLHF